MPLWWPFGRKKRRISTSTAASTSPTTATATTRTTTNMTSPTADTTAEAEAETGAGTETGDKGGEMIMAATPVSDEQGLVQAQAQTQTQTQTQTQQAQTQTQQAQAQAQAQAQQVKQAQAQQAQAQAATCPPSHKDSGGQRQRREPASPSSAFPPASNDTSGNHDANDPLSSDHALGRDRDRNRNRDRRGSVQHDITALPSMPELESSPHLRPANVVKPVHPYTLERPSSSRKPDVSGPGSHHNTPLHSPPAAPPKSKSSPHPPQPLAYSSTNKRPTDRVLREEQIRQMSAPVPIPKRPAGSANDLLRRDSKKARRTLTKRHDDPRSSTVSLPFPDSIHSAMSAVSERAWEVGGISILSPRPTVRLSGTNFNAQYAKRQPMKEKEKEKEKELGKLPEIARKASRKDRRKVADLADELDSSELRLLMERDQRRKERKATEQHERLDRKLRKRAEKQRADEERRAREARLRATPPTAVHPAFREQESSPTRDSKKAELEEDRGRSAKGGTYLRYPARQAIPQNPFADPQPLSNPFTTPPAEYYSPVQTPMEDPVLETAKAIRMSTGHISPPTSPTPDSSALAPISDHEPQRTTSISPGPAANKTRRPSESSARRTSTWASLFRRGLSASRASEDRLERPSQSDFSFVNASRESMSKQPIPAHLVQQPVTRQSGAPVRTQSKFREDLPELPISPPASRVQSPELSVAAANVAAARRAKRAAPKTEDSLGGKPMDIPGRGRTDSPTVFEDQPSTVLSQSFASIDSEGSWMSGRPVKHSSIPSQPRSSLGSVAKPKDDFAASFDRLPVPEHEYFATLTPEPGSRRVSGEQTVDTTPIAMINDDVHVPMRQGTARHRPTVVHNDPRYKSREGLLTEYESSEVMSPSRESSSSGDSADNSPVELKKAESVNYGRGHMKSLSAGSAKLLDITPSRSRSLRTSPAGSPHIPQG